MDRVQLAQWYFEDGQDYLKRYRVLFYSDSHDFQSIKSRRVKCYVDLRVTLEAILKSAICLAAKDEEDGETLLKRVKAYGHRIGELSKEAVPLLGGDESVLAALAHCDEAPIDLRYQAEAVPFRSGDDRPYYATIGDDAWLATLERFAQNALDHLDASLRQFSKVVDARTLWDEILATKR